MPYSQNSQYPKPKRTRRQPVPKALHTELTEYTSLLRALRTQHTLDLSTQLSQLPQRLISGQDEDDESEASLSQSDGDRRTEIDEAVDAQSHATDPPSPVHTPISTSGEPSQQPIAGPSSNLISTASLTGKKRKRSVRSRNDTWTRWPLLAGDVYPPEFGLDEEVKVIASHFLRQTRQRQHDSRAFPQDADTDTSDFEESVANDGDTESDDEDFKDPLEPLASNALASSTAHHLRSLLSACIAFIPSVEPSLRNRLAPLNWTSVLSAAASNSLASSEVIERVAKRLESIYGTQSGAPPNLQPAQCTLPITVQHSISSSTAVKRAREKLNSMLDERTKVGDGDFLSFTGEKPVKKRIRREKKKGNKAEVNKADTGESGGAEG